MHIYSGINKEESGKERKSTSINLVAIFEDDYFT